MTRSFIRRGNLKTKMSLWKHMKGFSSTIAGHFEFVFEETLVREITSFVMALLLKSFVLKTFFSHVVRSEKRSRKAPFWWRNSVDGRPEGSGLKALANEATLLRTHWCPWCFLGCANWEKFVAGTKCFRTKSEMFFVSRTHNSCPQQMLRARANGETFVSATMCPQQCVLVCQGLSHLQWHKQLIVRLKTI